MEMVVRGCRFFDRTTSMALTVDNLLLIYTFYSC